MKPVDPFTSWTPIRNFQFQAIPHPPLRPGQWIEPNRFTAGQNYMNSLSHAEAPKRAPRQSSPEQIAALAYQLYREKGCHNGYDVADWLEAEKKLSAPRSASSFPADKKAQSKNSRSASSSPNTRLV